MAVSCMSVGMLNIGFDFYRELSSISLLKENTSLKREDFFMWKNGYTEKALQAFYFLSIFFMGDLLIYFVYPILAWATIWLLQINYKAYNLDIKTINSVAKNHIQKALEKIMLFIIPIASLIYFFIYVELTKMFIFYVIFFSSLLVMNIMMVIIIRFFNQQDKINSEILKTFESTISWK